MSRYCSGQRWAFAAEPPPREYQTALCVWQTPDDDDIEVVIEFTAAARPEFDVRGSVLRVTAEVLEASTLKLIDEEFPLPAWLPDANADDELPERRLDSWKTLSEGTLQDYLSDELVWLRSLTRALERQDAEQAARALARNPEAHRETYRAPPLHLAVRQGDVAVVELILRHGADVSAADDRGRTPLHHAIDEGHAELARLLIDRGAPLDARDESGMTPIYMAASKDQSEILSLLEERGAPLDGNTLMRLGRFTVLRSALEKNKPLLQEACAGERLVGDLVEYLGKAEDLEPAVAEALPVVRLLLDRGLDPNNGFPLESAVRLQDVRLAELLLERGADPNQGAEDGGYLLPTPACGMAMRQLLRRHGAKSPEDADVVFAEVNERLENDPDDVEARRKRARAWWDMGQYRRAQHDLDVLFNQDPDDEAKLLQAWIWATCPEDGLRDGAEALDVAEKLKEPMLCDGILFEVDGSGESWTHTEFEELQTAALAELGEFDQALAILDELEQKNAGWEERARMARMRVCFEAEQPYRAAPVSAELAEFGRQQAELCAVAESAVIVHDEEEDSVEPDDDLDSERADEEIGELPIDEEGVLDLIGEPFGMEQLDRLLADPRLEQLTALRVSGGEMPAAVVLALAAKLRAPRLTRLELERAYFRDRVGVVLAKVAAWPLLSELNLEDNQLTRRTAEAIAANPAFASLKKLKLGSNHIRTRGALALAKAPHLTALEELDLAYNLIRDEGVRFLAESRNLPCLQRLNLRSNRLYGRSVALLVDAPLLARLKKLDLDGNRLRPEDAVRLAASPSLASLEELNFADNPIGPKGAKALAESPYCSRLQALHLNGCKIDDSTADALAASPHLTNLESLYVSEDELGGKAQKMLKKRFGDGLSMW